MSNTWKGREDELRGKLAVYMSHVGTMVGALYRIAQGVQDPEGRAQQTLRGIGATELADGAKRVATHDGGIE